MHKPILTNETEATPYVLASPVEIMRMELKKGRSMFPLFTIGEVGRLFEHFENSDCYGFLCDTLLWTKFKD